MAGRAEYGREVQGKAGRCMGLSGKDRAGQDMMARQGKTGQGRVWG